jgi:hypothetical protein
MKKSFLVARLDLMDVSTPLEEQVANLCNIYHSMNYDLAACFVFGTTLFFIFKFSEAIGINTIGITASNASTPPILVGETMLPLQSSSVTVI